MKKLLIILLLLVPVCLCAQSDYKKNIDAAKQGNAPAQCVIGYCFYKGEGVHQDYSMAAYWYRKAADQGYAFAQYAIGVCYYNGEGVTQNTEMAAYWWRLAAKQGHEESQKWLAIVEEESKDQQSSEESDYQKNIAAAKQGDAEAQSIIGYCYHNGEGVAQDYTQAVYWYQKAANQGEVIAQYNLGLCYDMGLGIAQDYTQAAYWYRKSAEQGNAMAQYKLAMCYGKGLGVAQNDTQSAYWFRKAADQGDSSAQFYLALCYQNGYGVTQDDTQAAYWYRKSAEQEDPDAQYSLGFCYYKGEGVTQDKAQANYWWRKAADQGIAKAQALLGLSCYTGDGVAQDYVQAVSWFRKAAEQGDSDAQNALGVCYQNGDGVTQDYVQAFSLYRKAAEQGDANAQCNLGSCYFNGEGVALDYVQAAYWFGKSAEQGNENAKIMLAEAQEKQKEKPKENSLATLEWIGFASEVNKKNIQLKIGVKSDSKIEEVNVTVNGTQSRGIQTVKSDGYDLTLDRSLTLSEGVNNIVVSVRNQGGTSVSRKMITYQTESSVQTSTGKRIALVIGNSHYKSLDMGSLKNPVNDATDVAAKLETLGFKVIRSLDNTQQQMEAAILDFGKQAHNYDVALFFYAGHGISCNGSNYLIPIDADLPEESYVQYKCTNANLVLDLMDKAQCQMKIVILDACRDNKFAKSWSRGVGGGGLSIMNAPRGTFISYSTGPGDVAQDGTGRNSPYTTALLQTLDIPNLLIGEVFDKVLEKVTASTNDRQWPWIGGSLRGKFIFNQK